MLIFISYVRKYMTTTKNKRFFAFGCSYTRWSWPTWSDLIGSDFDDNYYNYGQQGAGNQYIFNAFMEADVRHKFTKDDLIIIQLSGITREDRYANNAWQAKGTITNHEDYFIRNYFDFKGYLIRDMAFIKAMIDFLNNLGCEFYILSMNPLTSNNEFFIKHDDTVNDVIEFYKEYIDIVKPSFMEVLNYKRPLLLKNGRSLHDAHPLPIDHYNYLELVLPEYAVNKDLAIEWTDVVHTLNDEPNELWNESNYGNTFAIRNKGRKWTTRL